jgi:tyrosine-protein phosphatase SIW14
MTIRARHFRGPAGAKIQVMPMNIRVSALRAASTTLLIVLLGTSAGADSKSSSVGSVSALSSVSIFNFGEVSPAYYRGSELKGTAVMDLAKLGVKTVIDLRSDEDFKPAEPQAVEAANMKYVRIPMTTRTAPTAEQVSTFLELVQDPANQPVYVHCVEGRHRTGVMTAVYRMTVEGWNPDRAFDEMKRYKFGMTFLHPEFKEFVYSYRVTPTAPAAPAAPVVVSTEAAVTETN